MFHWHAVGEHVRRGINEMQHSGDMNIYQSDDKAKVPAWGMAMFGVTIAIFIMFITSIRYTLVGVVGTLTMIEEPKITTIVADEKSGDVRDVEVLTIKEEPVTSNIRKTIKHLVARGGRTARWRGASTALLYVMLHNFTYKFVSAIGIWSPNHDVHALSGFTVVAVHHVIVAIAAQVLLAGVAMQWTHHVISEPSTKRWYQRLCTSFSTYKKLVVPTTINAFAWQCVYMVPAEAFFAFNLQSTDYYKTASPCTIAAKAVLVLALGFVTFIGIYVPTEVSLIRVQASMLPEDQESIVTFDRTFAGRVVPEILGGSGKLGFFQAWSTFNRSARARLLKFYTKVFAIEVFMHMFFAIVLATELFIMVASGAIKPEHVAMITGR